MTPLDRALLDLDRARRDLRHAVRSQKRNLFAGEPESPQVLAAYDAVRGCEARVSAFKKIQERIATDTWVRHAADRLANRVVDGEVPA
jgi:hypothetical protein